MALRLIEVIGPAERAEGLEDLLGEHTLMGLWRERLAGDLVLVRVLLDAQVTEGVLDGLTKRYGRDENFRLIVLPVEATLPRPEPEDQEEPANGAESLDTDQKNVARISREELYADISDSARLTVPYVAMVVLSSVVATIGVLRDEVAVIIGAMVIAPLLGPNVALSLGTTLGDLPLVRRALVTNAVGLVAAAILPVIVGLSLTVDLGIGAIASRTGAGLDDAALAVAAGAAGAIAFTSGLPATVIGVMVAVALLPPLVVVALLTGAGEWQAAGGAALLVVVNVVGINLSGVGVFLLQGIRPVTWWEAERAKHATRIAIALWTALLLAFVGGILWSARR